MSLNKKKLLKYLKSHELMSLATCDKTPSVCTVYYGIDNNFNIFIVTPPSTEHGRNIAKNRLVACAIADSNQPMVETKYKIGVQIKGIAKKITDLNQMKNALKIWSKNRKNIIDMFMKNITEGTWKSSPFIIKPKEIKWFNEELYGEEGFEIFKF